VGQSFNTQKYNTENETQFSQGLGSFSIQPLPHGVVDIGDPDNEIHTGGIVSHMNPFSSQGEDKVPDSSPVLGPNSPLNHSSTVELETKVSSVSTPSTTHSSSSILSDDTPVISNVSQSQLNAASVLMNLNQRSTTNFDSPNKTTNILNLSQKRKDKNLSVSFDLMEDDAPKINPFIVRDHVTTPSFPRFEPTEDFTNTIMSTKRRRFTSDHNNDDDENLNSSSCCSLQCLTSLPIVTPKTNVKTLKESSDLEFDDTDFKVENDTLDEMEDEGSKQLFLYTQ
jgi:hypothetical protein